MKRFFLLELLWFEGKQEPFRSTHIPIENNMYSKYTLHVLKTRAGGNSKKKVYGYWCSLEIVLEENQ